MPFGSPYSYDGMGAWFGNRFNWLGLLRALWIITTPLKFLIAILLQRVPTTLAVRTPIGTITLRLRNYESLKTLFGVFCRKDYATPSDQSLLFYDIGANIGFATVYFLSRNYNNLVRCFEPDETNLDWLKRNLAAFQGRVTIVNCAVTTQTGEAVIYRADSGKHSSIYRSKIATVPQRVSTRSLEELLNEASPAGFPKVVKLDVEGLEEELVKSVKFENHPGLSRLVCESTMCSALIRRPHRRLVRNGYIEDLCFIG